MTEDEKQLTFDFFDPQEETTTPRWADWHVPVPPVREWGVFVCSNGWFGVPGGPWSDE